MLREKDSTYRVDFEDGEEGHKLNDADSLSNWTGQKQKKSRALRRDHGPYDSFFFFLAQ